MNPDLMQAGSAETEESGLVSERFLSDLFRSLKRHNVSAAQMLGDLPIPVDESGRVARPIEWADFAEFMKRLENHVDGAEGLEACGEWITELKPAWVLQSLVGSSASPYLLYRTASLWALRRALPGIQTRIREVEPNRIQIHIRLKDGLRPCPQLFHLATGSARALPRILGMADAVVSAKIGEFEALYEITLPPSRTLWARATRVFRTLFSANSVLQFLEAQQLELHAKHEALEKTRSALDESERRYRAITDTAVDVLCELNEQGQILFVSASVEDLMGYSPEQITGSHFSLWVPSDDRRIVKKRFEAFISQPIEHAITRERIRLHTETGGQIVAELSLRSYRAPEGERRMVGILRNETDRPRRKTKDRSQREPRQPNDSNALRSTVENLRRSNAEHPIQKSLAVLLAAIESNPSDRNPDAMISMIAATERMTQIVDRAIVHTHPNASLNFRWLETKKLIDLIHLEFQTRHAQDDVDLQIDTSNAPPLTWGEDGVLGAGLGSLLDWAAEKAHRPASITLRVEATGSRANHDASVVFSVSHSSSATADNRPTEPTKLDPLSILSLTTAEDAAIALGGELILPEDASHYRISRIRLPQTPSRN